jgi:acyl carrier protein
MAQTLSDSEKSALATKIKEFLAEECDMDVSEITDDTDIMEDLKADSLVFLELIQEIQQDYKLDIELRQIGKYIVKHPVKTVGEAIETLYQFIERGPELLKQLEEEEAAAKAAEAPQS